MTQKNSEWTRVEGAMPDNWTQRTVQKRKPRVLLADDELHIRALMKAVMASMKCEVVGEAKNGQEALDMFRREKPELLLLDINMPVKTGEEVLKEITSEFPDAFVIMLTSVADAESVETCLNFGAATYIRKDTPLEDMKKIIKETWETFRKLRSEK